MPKRLAALNKEAAAENGGRHTVEVAIEAIELVIRVDGEKHTMTPVRVDRSQQNKNYKMPSNLTISSSMVEKLVFRFYLGSREYCTVHCNGHARFVLHIFPNHDSCEFKFPPRRRTILSDNIFSSIIRNSF